MQEDLKLLVCQLEEAGLYDWLLRDGGEFVFDEEFISYIRDSLFDLMEVLTYSSGDFIGWLSVINFECSEKSMDKGKIEDAFKEFCRYSKQDLITLEDVYGGIARLYRKGGDEWKDKCDLVIEFCDMLCNVRFKLLYC